MKNFFSILLILALVSVNYAQNKKTFQLIDTQGNAITTLDAEAVYPLINGLTRVKKSVVINNKWVRLYGYLNEKGEEVIPFKFSKAADFIVDYVWVKINGEDHFSLLHKSGKIIPTKNYEKVGYMYDFQPDLFAVYEDGKMGFIDASGKEVIPCKYLGDSFFKQGLACVTLAGSDSEKYGFINKQGEMEIPMKFKQSGTSSFDGEYCRAKVSGKTVLIDTKGNTVLTTSNGNIQGKGAVAGLVLFFNGSNRTDWGWINFKDEVVIEPIYDYAKDFNDDGYAIVEKDGFKGLIDTTGKVVIPIEYETIYADVSKDGFILATYKMDEATTLIKTDKDFFDKNLEKLKLDNVAHLSPSAGGELIPYYDYNGKVGYLTKDYTIAIPAQYRKGSRFSDGVAWVRLAK